MLGKYTDRLMIYAAMWLELSMFADNVCMNERWSLRRQEHDLGSTMVMHTSLMIACQ